MFSRTFEYLGYDGQMHKETYWFNLSDAELFEMQLGTIGGMDGMMNRMLKEEHPEKIVEMFKTVILKSVGERSADGRKFVKKERPGMPWGEVAEDFRETPAYSQLFTELVSSAEKLKQFLLAAIPEEVVKKIAEAEAAAKEAEAKENVQTEMELPEVTAEVVPAVVTFPGGTPERSDG